MTDIRPIRDARLGLIVGGTYRLEEVLGRGASGTVYRAVNVRDGTLAAVKVLRRRGGLLATADTALPHDEEEADEQRSARRFAREARIVAGMNHPHIVKVYAFEADGPDEPYLAMELLDGEPLSQLLRRRTLSPAEALELYTPLCSAISYAHAQGIVHRDLKPDNVFLVAGKLSDPRVLDFGISKVIQPEASQLTTDAILGTPAYMAPELIRSPAQVDHRADLFALGAMLFRALTGQLAFDGDTMLAVLHKVLRGRPPPASQVRPGLPPALDAVLERSMAHEPAHRYQSAQELLEALRAAVHGSPSHARPAMLPTMPLPAVAAGAAQGAHAVAQTLMMPRVETAPPEVSGPSWGAVSETEAAVAMEPSRVDLRLSRPLLPSRWWLAALVGGVLGAVLALLGLP